MGTGHENLADLNSQEKYCFSDESGDSTDWAFMFSHAETKGRRTK